MVRGRDVEMVIVDATGNEVTARILVNGTDVSEMLVGSGLAWVTPECADSDLVELADRARELPCGLWTDPEPVPPWEFRAGTS
jgi:endonuclease YncB( thermonuclease family)